MYGLIYRFSLMRIFSEQQSNSSVYFENLQKYVNFLICKREQVETSGV